MNPTRFKVLLGVAGLLLVMILWNWISGWGLVTVHAEAQPLSKVIRAIERQGGIKIVTNADPNEPVSMEVDRVKPVEAVDTLAAWLDGNWSVAYAAGPTKADVNAGVAVLQEGGRNADFVRFGGGGGGFGEGDLTETVIDVRRVEWNVTPSETGQLQSYLDQLSQKTGLVAIAPQAWNPSVGSTPTGGAAADAVRKLVKAANGEIAEVFTVRVQTEERDRGPRPEGDRPERTARTEGGFGGGAPGGGRREMRPEWAEERMQARLAQLPAGERERVGREANEMRETWQKMRALPEAERRVAMEKLFNDPAVQERMMERQMSRDAKRSPEKRADRFRRYIERKKEMKASS